MAVMSAFSVRVALPPRHTPAASTWRMPPRVYSPLTPRRLARPMAVPATQGAVIGTSGGTHARAIQRTASRLSFLHKR
jgi:hypothetical protein